MVDLEALRCPPRDADLQGLVVDLDERERWAGERGFDDAVDRCSERKVRVWRWIAETSGVARDPWSGLTYEQIDRNGWVDDDVLGRVPVALRAATAQIWLESDGDERRIAACMARDPSRGDSDWKATHAFASLAGASLGDLLRWLAGSDDPSAVAVMEEWRRGNLPQLLQKYLDE